MRPVKTQVSDLEGKHGTKPLPKEVFFVIAVAILENGVAMDILAVASSWIHSLLKHTDVTILTGHGAPISAACARRSSHHGRETIQFVNGRSMGCMCELNNQSRFWCQNEKVLQPNKQLGRHRTSKYASTTRSMCCTRSVWHLVPFANGVAWVLPTIRNRFESWLKLSRRFCNNGGLVPEVAHGRRIVDGGVPQAPILNRPRGHVRG